MSLPKVIYARMDDDAIEARRVLTEYQDNEVWGEYILARRVRVQVKIEHTPTIVEIV